MAKNLLNKYVWLVETIYKAGRITFEEINEKWLDNDMSEGVELPLRTFHKWRITAEEMFGLIIECERKGGYHYYIANSDEIKSGSLRSWLLNCMAFLVVSNILKKSRSVFRARALLACHRWDVRRIRIKVQRPLPILAPLFFMINSPMTGVVITQVSHDQCS